MTITDDDFNAAARTLGRDQDQNARRPYTDPLAPNPEEAAQHRVLANRSGLPEVDVRLDLNAAARAANAADASRVLGIAPRLRDWLDDPANSNVARDDVHNLSVFETLANLAGRYIPGAREAAAPLLSVSRDAALWSSHGYSMGGLAPPRDYAQRFRNRLNSGVGADALGISRGVTGLTNAVGGFVHDLPLNRSGQEDTEGSELNYAWGRAESGEGPALTPEQEQRRQELNNRTDANDWGPPILGTLARLEPQMEGQFGAAGQAAGEGFSDVMRHSGADLATARGVLNGTAAVPLATLVGAGHGLGGYVRFNYEQETGQAYQQMRQDGIEPAIAWRHAQEYGAAATALEFTGDAIGLKLSGATRLAARTMGFGESALIRSPLVRAAGDVAATGLFEEGPTEAFQQLAQSIHEHLAQQEQHTGHNDLIAALQMTPDDISQILQSYWIGAQGGSGMAMIPAGANLALDLRASREAAAGATQFEAQTRAAQASLLNERQLPDVLESAVAHVDPSNVYIDADKFVEHFQSAGANAYAVADELGIGANKLATAVNSHGQVEIPTSTFAARLLRVPQHQVLQDHARITPTSATPAEAKVATEQVRADIERMVEETKGIQSDNDFGQAIETRMRDILAKAEGEGGPRAEVASRYASLAAALPRAVVARARAVDPAFADRLEGKFRDMFGAHFDVAGPTRTGGMAGASLDQADGAPHATPLQLTTPEHVQAALDLANNPDSQAEDMLSTPLMQAVHQHVKDTPDTATKQQLADPEFLASREYAHSGNGEPLNFDEAVNHLVEIYEAAAGPKGPAKRRQATIIMGYPGAGKSTFAESLARKNRMAALDADVAKGLIPAYEDGLNTQAVHNESAALRIEAMNDILAKGENVLMERVGDDPAALFASLEHLQEHGYEVSLVHIKVDPNEAVRRAVRRFIGTGRYIEPQLWRRILGKVDGAFEQAIEDPRWKGYVEVDANGPKGTATEIRQGGEAGKTLSRDALGGQASSEGSKSGGRSTPAPEGGEGELNLPWASGLNTAKIGNTEVQYAVHEDGSVTISRVRTPEGQRRKGSARAAMQALIAEADRHGATTFLTPQFIMDGEPGNHHLPEVRNADLVKFYRSLGYRRNTGRARDFRSTESYVRAPQEIELNQEARGSIVFKNFKPGEFGDVLIKLGQASDLSTFLHEFGHFGHLVLESIASDPNAPAEFKSMWANTLSWWGVDQARWDALSEQERVPYYEQWARSFEAYLMEGKAPSFGLREAFATFKEWLKQIYRTLRLDHNLNPQIRDVFDRMLASDEEIAQSRAEMGADFSLSRKAFKTDEEFQQYRQAIRNAKDAQEAELRARAMDAFVRKSKRWWRNERERVRPEARRFVDSDPARRAHDWLAFDDWRALPNTEDDSENAYVPPADSMEQMPEGLPPMQMSAEALAEQWPNVNLPVGLNPRIDPETVLTEAMSLKAIDKGRGPKRAARLWRFIKDNGGIQDPDGSIRSAMGGGRARPGVINQNGKSAEQMLRLATEAGYFGDGAARELNQKTPHDGSQSFNFEGESRLGGNRHYTIPLPNGRSANLFIGQDGVVQWGSPTTGGTSATGDAVRIMRGVRDALTSDAERFGAQRYTFSGNTPAHDSLYEFMSRDAGAHGFDVSRSPDGFTLQRAPQSPNVGHTSNEGQAALDGFIRGDATTQQIDMGGYRLYMRKGARRLPQGDWTRSRSLERRPNVLTVAFIDRIDGRAGSVGEIRQIMTRLEQAAKRHGYSDVYMENVQNEHLHNLLRRHGDYVPDIAGNQFTPGAPSLFKTIREPYAPEARDGHSTSQSSDGGFEMFQSGERAADATLRALEKDRAELFNAKDPEEAWDEIAKLWAKETGGEHAIIYHGSAAPLRGIRPVLFTSNNKGTAAFFAHLDRRVSGGVERITPLKAKFENPLVIDGHGYVITNALLRHKHLADLVTQAQADGHDAIIFKNVLDGPAMDQRSEFAEPTNVVVVLDPSKVKKLPADYVDASPIVKRLLSLTGSFQLFQPSVNPREEIRSRVESAGADIPRNPIPWDRVQVAYPKADESTVVSARPATESGDITTSWGANLHYEAGRDIIVGEDQGDARPVRQDIFEKTFRETEPGSNQFVKRSDVPVGFFTADKAQTIQTLEGPVEALPGDMILIGGVGEMWPVKPEKFAQRYDVPEQAAPAQSDRVPNADEFVRTLIADLNNERQVYSSKDGGALSSAQDLEDARAWFDANNIDLSKDKEEIRSQIIAALEKAKAEPGLHPDDVAPWFGFSSGDELIQALSSLKPRAQAIEDAIDGMLGEQYGDAMSPDRIKAEAEKAAHVEAQANAIELELAALQQATGGRKTPVSKAARAYAQERVNAMSVAQVRRSDMFLAGERRAARNAMEAAEKGKHDEAAMWKQRQLISFWMYRFSRDAADEMDRAQNYFRKFDSDSVRARIHPPLMDQIDQALEGIDLRKKPAMSDRRRQSFLSWVQSMQAEGLDDLIVADPDVIAEAQNRPFASLSLEEARGMRDAVKNFEHIGRRWREVLDAKKNRLLDEAVAEMSANMATVKPLAFARPDDHSPGIVESIDMGRQRLHGQLARVEFMARAMDGYKNNGPVWNNLFRPLTEARDREETRQDVAHQQVDQLFSAYSAKERADMWTKKTFCPQVLNRRTGRMGMNFTKQEVLSIALNTGNEYNFKALVDGFEWSPDQVRALLDAAMDQRDWQFVQGVWDYLESFYPEIEALYVKTAGVAPPKVQATPFTNRFGEWRGGYMPAVYDSRGDSRVREEAEATAVQNAFGGLRLRTQTPNSFAKARQSSGGRPIKLDLGVVTEHVNGVIHDLEFRVPVLDAWRLIKHQEFRRSFMAAAGEAQYNELKPWLQYVATEKMPPERGFTAALRMLRRNTPIALMGYAVSTVAQQPAGILGSFHRVGVGRTLAKALEVGANPLGWADHARFINTRSAMMRHRTRISQRDIREMVAEANQDHHVDAVRLLATGNARQKLQALGQINRYIQRWSLFPLAFLDKWVSSITWKAAYDQALGGHVDGVDPQSEADVIAHADQIVRTTWGSGRPEDLPAIMRQNELGKLITPAFSYFSTQYNQIYSEQLPGMMRGKISPIEFATFMFWTIVMQALVSEWAAGRGSKDGEDDDDRNKRLALTVGAAPLAGVPIIRDMARSAASTFASGRPFDFTAIPAVGAISDTTNGITGAGIDLANGDGIDRQAARHLVIASGYWFGIPSRQMWTTGSYLADMANGNEDPSRDPVDAAQEAFLRDSR